MFKTGARWIGQMLERRRCMRIFIGFKKAKCLHVGNIVSDFSSYQDIWSLNTWSSQRCDAIRYDAMQCDVLRFVRCDVRFVRCDVVCFVRCDAIWCDAMQCGMMRHCAFCAMRCALCAMQCDVMLCALFDAMLCALCDAMWCYAMRYNAICSRHAIGHRLIDNFLLSESEGFNRQ